MTDWLREHLGTTLALGVLCVLVLLASWELWSRRKLRAFRLTDARMTADRQRGPLWNEPLEFQDKQEKPRAQ